ncbi:MAG: GtrA family protein [Candidatus Spechtbacteria bacterium]|nr:GtrA family protein [Candidatus Spechtbacteria bacterium]
MSNFRKVDILLSAVIGEAVAWLLFVMVRVNAPELPIPSGLAQSLSSLNTAFVMAVVFPILSVAVLFVVYLFSKKILLLYQATKFIQVGALNTFIDLGVLNFLILISGVAGGPLFSAFKGISFTVAVINSYFWNKHWIFKSKDISAGKEFSQFIFVSFVGFLINVGTASVMVNVIGPQGGIAPAVWANVGALAATFVSLGWNFIGYKFWVFK